MCVWSLIHVIRVVTVISTSVSAAEVAFVSKRSMPCGYRHVKYHVLKLSGVRPVEHACTKLFYLDMA